MKSFFSTLTAVLLLCFLYGCNKAYEDVECTHFKSKYYIQAYVDADNIDIQQNKTISDNKSLPSAYVFLNGTYCDYKGESGFSVLKKQEKAAEFIYDNLNDESFAYIPNEGDSTNIQKIKQKDLNYYINESINKFIQLAKDNNDTSWFGTTVQPLEHFVINDSIVSIKIITKTDYDKLHLEGTNMADIIKFIGSSPYDYIQNGYKNTKEKFWTEEMTNGGVHAYTYEPIICYCNQISQQTTHIFDRHFDLLFTKKPEKNGIYNFELKLELSQKTLETPFSMEF